MYKVYKHTFPNNKIYIGITSKKPLERWNNGNGYNNCRYMRNAIKKYGWENVKHEILFDNLNKEEAEEKEIELIAKYKSNNQKYGYNIANGGNSVGMMSNETKKILSNQRKGKNNPMYHIYGKDNPKSIPINQYSMDGKYIKTWSCSAEAERETQIPKTKIIACCKGRRKSTNNYQWKYYIGNNNNIEKYRKKDVSGKNNPMYGKPSHLRKKVIQYDLNGNYITEYNSLLEAGEKNNISFKQISSCCRGERKKTHGFIFKYY